MRERKPHLVLSPDLNNFQEVLIDQRTRIYIPKGADPDKAKARFLLRLTIKKNP